MYHISSSTANYRRPSIIATPERSVSPRAQTTRRHNCAWPPRPGSNHPEAVPLCPFRGDHYVTRVATASSHNSSKGPFKKFHLLNISFSFFILFFSTSHTNATSDRLRTTERAPHAGRATRDREAPQSGAVPPIGFRKSDGQSRNKEKEEVYA